MTSFPHWPYLHAALVEAVKQTSLKKTARDSRLSTTGVKKLIEGSNPYLSTYNKVAAWYVRRLAELGTPPSAEDVEIAREVLLLGAPAGEARELARALVEEELQRGRTREASAPAVFEWTPERNAELEHLLEGIPAERLDDARVRLRGMVEELQRKYG